MLTQSWFDSCWLPPPPTPPPRLLLEVVSAVAAAIGPERTGLRLSPFNVFLNCIESKPYDTFDYVVKELNKLKLSYVHMVGAGVG